MKLTKVDVNKFVVHLEKCSVSNRCTVCSKDDWLISDEVVVAGNLKMISVTCANCCCMVLWNATAMGLWPKELV